MQPLTAPYWVENGQFVICDPCKEARTSSGLQLGALLGATLFGGIAAILAGLAWGMVTWATGYNIGLIAIVAGGIVAVGVRIGAGRGGAMYQMLAALLTYLSIAVAETAVGVSMLSAEGADTVELLLASTAGLVAVFFMLIPSSIENGDIIGLLIYGFAIYQAIQMTAASTFAGPFHE